MSKLRVVIADSQSDVRYALGVLLQLVRDLDAEVAGEVSSEDQLIRLLDTQDAHLLLLDWNLPGLPDVDRLDRISSRYPQLKIIVLSGRPDARQEALLAGADGFANKIDSVQPLVALIRNLRKTIFS
jgi:DNA-binding NarL/FixJ family response regulator